MRVLLHLAELLLEEAGYKRGSTAGYVPEREWWLCLSPQEEASRHADICTAISGKHPITAPWVAATESSRAHCRGAQGKLPGVVARRP